MMSYTATTRLGHWGQDFLRVHLASSVQFLARKEGLIIAHEPKHFLQMFENLVLTEPRFRQ